MTKIAVISDIHANKHALDLVLKDIEKRNVNKIVCLGDLVTKYFYPAEVVDAIMKNCDIVVKGNCDDFVATDERYKFARGELGLSKIEYLDNLPLKEQLIFNKAILNFFHATPYNLDGMFNPLFKYNKVSRYKDRVLEEEEYDKMFLDEKPQISFVGHTHDDYIAIENENKLEIAKDPIIIPNTKRAIINVGSVGEHSKMKKNDEGDYAPYIDNYLSYIILDDSNKNAVNVEIIKIPYTDTLKKVYFDMLKKQKEGTAPYSPLDTKKVLNSLLDIGVEAEEIDNESKKRGLL